MINTARVRYMIPTVATMLTVLSYVFVMVSSVSTDFFEQWGKGFVYLASLVSGDRAHAQKVINLLNRVPEHDCLDFFRATQNEM